MHERHGVSPLIAPNWVNIRAFPPLQQDCREVWMATSSSEAERLCEECFDVPRRAPTRFAVAPDGGASTHATSRIAVGRGRDFHPRSGDGGREAIGGDEPLAGPSGHDVRGDYRH